MYQICTFTHVIQFVKYQKKTHTSIFLFKHLKIISFFYLISFHNSILNIKTLPTIFPLLFQLLHMLPFMFTIVPHY